MLNELTALGDEGQGNVSESWMQTIETNLADLAEGKSMGKPVENLWKQQEH